MASSRSYRSRSPPHKVPPRDRGVANSDYYRPSYAVRSASKSSESKGQAPSVVSAHIFGESLDDEETPGTKSWAELASCKHREWTAPAASSAYSDLPSPIEESWAEMASRKHKELMAIEASKAAALAKVTPTTPANPRYARSFLGNRTRLREIEGLDIQRQVSSLTYPRKVKAGALPVEPKDSRVYSREPISALELGMHASKQSLSSFPLQDSPENSYITAEPHHPISPPKVQVNTETLRSRLQELPRASFASEKPRPIRSIMDEPFFDDDAFESEPNDFEPVVPTHWQD
ncbi:hypothetical protein DSL72_002403 [Monilinia vaccinii-corymbosi]|uniref:Uncharacterized protein n=1 Tax=Monilinia vaccinii-corymbosi TaxID=61207 RepID=A0A8A3PCL4_9HELO|nr:hypothetical protein DSL72_002403 [Monilinia vaccinii-corymbosi]